MTNQAVSRRIFVVVSLGLLLGSLAVYFVASSRGASSAAVTAEQFGTMFTPTPFTPTPLPAFPDATASMQYIEVPSDIDFSMQYVEVPSGIDFSLWPVELLSSDELPTIIPVR
jgi:hypothetical protein